MQENKAFFKVIDRGDGTCAVYLAGGEAPEALEFPSEIDGLAVAEIGENACADRENLRTVTIPRGVKTSGDGAFCRCTHLATVHLPGGITSIARNAFADCESLSCITCPTWDSYRTQGLVFGLSLPEERATTFPEGAGEYAENRVLLYTVPAFSDETRSRIYKNGIKVELRPYTEQEVEAFLTESEGYSLTFEKHTSYDVYSSREADNDDHTVEKSPINIGLSALVVSEGELCGFYVKHMGLEGIVMLGGESLGNTYVSNRTLCYGHPYDYYKITSKRIVLKKK